MLFCNSLQLYDAAIVANRKHAASWHGWGLLEKRQGNLVRARDLWLKVSLPSFLQGLLCPDNINKSNCFLWFWQSSK